MDCHPFYPLAGQILLSAVIIGVTNSSSLIRRASLPLIAGCVCLVIRNSMAYMIRSPWAGLVGGYSISLFTQYLDIGLLSRYDFDTKAPIDFARPTPPKSGRGTIFQRLCFSLSLLTNFRFIDTPQELKNIPPFSSRDPKYIPTRKQFIIHSTLVAAASYLVLDLISSNSDPEIESKYLSVNNIPVFGRLSEISVKELVIRIITTVVLGIGMNCVQGGIYNLFGLVSVACGVSDPEIWPPFYGSVLEAFSLRRFWSIYWHQINTRKLLSISKFVLVDVFHLPPNTQATRYFRLITVFFISGVMHRLIDVASGVPLRESGAMSFFMVQTVGIIIEDIFIKVYKAYCGSSDGQAKLWEYIAGYFWVLGFLTWSVPSYLFPVLSRSGPGNSTIPFSIVNKLQHGHW